jgi:hypothetical protein
MLIINIRRSITLFVIIGSIVSLLLVWIGWIEIFGLKDDSHPYINTVLATLIPTTATFGIAALAIIFLTAQISAANGKPSVLRELYRSNDIYVLFGFIILNVVGGYISFVLNTDLPVTILECKLLDSILVSAIATVLLILPTIMSQIENLDPVILASKLSSRIEPKEIKKYGLTDINISEDGKEVTKYQLITVGLRPHGIDPLRPMHEIIMDAVKARDRVLFGKLFRYLLQPIADFHSSFWDPTGVEVFSKNNLNLAVNKSKYKLDEQLHLTLAIIHYAVKRARNLLTEWGGLDIGRHGILTGIGDLIRSLARVEGTETAVRICLYATLHIEKFYSNVTPFGRVEPMNAYFQAAQELFDFGKSQEADFCITMLAWIATHTKQLSAPRSKGIEKVLSEELQDKYLATKNYFVSNPEEFPTDNNDPWKDWLNT